MNTVEIEGVTKTYGSVTAVDDLSLAVPAGSIYGFIGPNGSGKTTTLRMIMNIFYPDRGTIRVFGESVNGGCTDRIGYLPEERGLYKKMKVRDVLRFYGALKGGRDVNRKVDGWLEKLGLADWGKKKVETLSKGMSQKVQFIAAVVTAPPLLILDEPFSGLDPVNAEALKDAILEMQRAGTTIIFSTHDMGVAEKMCDFIFMIYQGRKVLDGTLTAIQDEYGQDTLRLRTENGKAAMVGIEGVESVNDFGQVQELRLGPAGDPQKVLAHILERTRVLSFEIARPSLQDIFIRIAKPQTEEAQDA